MRIPAIANYNFVQTQRPEKSLRAPSAISFQKVDKVLADKLSHVLPLIGYGDVVTVGKNVNEIKAGLQKTISLYSGAIKRILHINTGIANPMAFFLNDLGALDCINMGDKAFALVRNVNDTDIPVKHFAIDPADGRNIQDGDVIVNGKKEIEYKNLYLGIDMTEAEKFFEATYASSCISALLDFTKSQTDAIEKVNRALFAQKVNQTFQTQAEATERTSLSEAMSTRKLSFRDVGGLDSVIDELKRNVVYPIKYPFAYEDVALNRGILLYGGPGTGKTLLAEALAGECDAYYKKICGSELESKWVGESEAHWRALFDEAKKNQPAILFIDEFDSVAKNRDDSMSEHGSKVVNQVLALMSDLEKENAQVYVIAATNKPELFDSAVLRSGRFGKHIKVEAPDRSGLDSIFSIHTRNKKLDENLNISALLDTFASRKMTGADIKYIVNEAHLNSWLRMNVFEKMEQGTFTKEDMSEIFITYEDFEKALKAMDKQKNKSERKIIGFRQDVK